MVVFGFKISLNLSYQFLGLILILIFYSSCCICDLDKEIAIRFRSYWMSPEQGKKA